MLSIEIFGFPNNFLASNVAFLIFFMIQGPRASGLKSNSEVCYSQQILPSCILIVRSTLFCKIFLGICILPLKQHIICDSSAPDVTKSWRLLTPGQILTSDSIECYLDKITEWIQNIQWSLYLHINDILGSSNSLIDDHRFRIINKYICIYKRQIYWVRILTWDISNLLG